MDFDDTDSDSGGREKWLTGVRLFKDQIEGLKWLVVHKYRNNRSSADLIREAIDQFIDREKSELLGIRKSRPRAGRPPLCFYPRPAAKTTGFFPFLIKL